MSFAVISTQSLAVQSNLDNFSYPAHHCGEKIKKPQKPALLSGNIDVEKYNSAIVDYNIEVSKYNKKIKNYKTCINQYIKKGNNDINKIKTMLNNALKEARKRN